MQQHVLVFVHCHRASSLVGEDAEELKHVAHLQDLRDMYVLKERSLTV